MKDEILHVHYRVFASLSELDKAQQQLAEKAISAMHRAYAPYSMFHVGAAVLFDDGSIIEGNNQENAAYPSGLCAERVALFYAGATYPGKTIKKIAVVAGSVQTDNSPSIVSPCGACRQVMIETESRQTQPIEVILISKSGNGIVFSSMRDLLPLAFDVLQLKEK